MLQRGMESDFPSPASPCYTLSYSREVSVQSSAERCRLFQETSLTTVGWLCLPPASLQPCVHPCCSTDLQSETGWVLSIPSRGCEPPEPPDTRSWSVPLAGFKTVWQGTEKCALNECIRQPSGEMIR